MMETLVTAMTTAAPDIVASVAARAPKRTGKLAQSTKARRYTKSPVVRLRLTSNLEYARYVIGGTGIHGPNGARIYPVQAKVLHWTQSGQNIFAKSTEGQMPNDYPKKAFTTVKENLKTRIQQAINDKINS